MDVGSNGGWSWYDDVGGGYDQEGVCAIGFEGKGSIKSAGKRNCYKCGSPGHCPRECPYQRNGQSESKGYNCGEAGHPAQERPKGKEGGRKFKKEKDAAQKGKAKENGGGERELDKLTEKPSARLKVGLEGEEPSPQASGKEIVNITNQDGYELIKRPKGQLMPDSFAVDVEGSGHSAAKEL